MTAQIVCDPAVLGGKPCIAGTRISVELVLEELGGGGTVDDFLSDYSFLTREQVLEAIRYAGLLCGQWRGERTNPLAPRPSQALPAADEYDCECFDGLNPHDGVTQLAVTRRTNWFLITYHEGETDQCVEASSRDGVHYEGNYYHYKRLAADGGYGDTNRKVTFTMYEAADGSAMLVGEWRNHNIGGERGEWCFRFRPRPARTGG